MFCAIPQKDESHQIVKEALVKDGWDITDDPYVISYGERFLFVDLAASTSTQGQFIGAQRKDQLMDKKNYQQAIKNVIALYSKFRPSHGNIRLDTVFDDAQGHYALMQVGWDRGRRVRGNLIYIVLENEKVVIEYDGIERGISEDLIAQGVDEQDIVLAFLDVSSVAIAA